MKKNEARFYPYGTGGQIGSVNCRLCPSLRVTPLSDSDAESLRKPALYECGETRVGLESNEPDASVSPVPGIIGMLAGNQVLVVGVNSWEPSFICPNPSVKASVNK